MLGRFARMLPECARFLPCVCVGLKVYIDLMTHTSSITEAICGHNSLTSTPPRPYFLNWNGDGSKPPVSRSVRKPLTAAGRWPAYFARAGFGSNISNCEGPPVRNRKMTCLALGAIAAPVSWPGVAACAEVLASEPSNPTDPSPPQRD